MNSTPALLRRRCCLLLLAAILTPALLVAANDSARADLRRNVDRRTEGKPGNVQFSPAVKARADAAATLHARVPHARVDLDAVTGAPAFIRSFHGLLTAPGGDGPAIPAASLNRHAAGDPHRVIKAFVDEYSTLFGHDSSALSNARLSRDYVTAHNGVRTTVWEQHLDGIRVFEGVLQAHVTSRGELVNIASKFIGDPEQAAERGTPGRRNRIAEPAVTARDAVLFAAAALGLELTDGELTAGSGPAGVEAVQTFTSPSLLEVTARYVWLPLSADTMRLGWEVVCTTKDDGYMYRLVVDADTGDVAIRQTLTEQISNASYRVFTSDSPTPFSPGLASPSTYQPAEVPRTLVTIAALDTTASPNGWINDGVMETRGNNVDAHTDIDANNIADLPRPQASGPNRVFDPALDLTQSPSTYRDAAVVDLFYWCNWMHDRLYQLGFTEAAGNFQIDNFGRGGLGNDALQADAQDGSGTNNANFSTPADGSAPRMQMFIYTGPTPDRDGDFDHEVVLHEYTHGLSNRLVGGGVGMSATVSRGMGEGWSDFYGIALLTEPGDDPDGNWARGGYSRYGVNGTFFENYYYGGRRYPYSTNLGVNPLTFKDIDPTQASAHAGVLKSPIVGGTADEVHNMGEVWCAILWEARANFVRKHGHSGNELILKIVTDGMKLSPANPNFVQARDAILQAELADTAGQNRGELWAAFAKRGLGASASAPASSTTVGLVEAYDVPDALAIAPSNAITLSGDVGGPFVPQTYFLSNTGSAPLTWSLTKSQPWIDVAPSSGVLAAGQTATVTVTVNSLGSSLSYGSYTDQLTFTNTTTGIPQQRQFNVVIAAPPTITAFVPTALTPGMTVTITGTNFMAPASVMFGNIGSTNVSVVSSTQMTAVVPSGVTGGQLTVTTPGGAATSATSYTVTTGPVITSFTPSSGPVKRWIIVNGFNFSGTGVTSRTIRVNGVQVSSYSYSSTRISFPVPAGATTGPISVQTNLGTATSATNFIVTSSGAAPANDSFASASTLSGSSGSTAVNTTFATKEPGEANHAMNAGGASVWYSWTAPSSGPYLFQVQDTGFAYGVVVGVYTGSAVDALTLVATGNAGQVYSRYSSSVSFNAVAGTTYRIAIDGYDGYTGETSLAWAPLSAPTVSAITSSAYSGQPIGIAGTGFTPTTAVSIGGVQIPSSGLTYSSATSLTVNQLPAAAANGQISITTIAGSITVGNVGITTALAPSISGISPTSGIVGSAVVISGAALSLNEAAPPVVKFNGVPVATITSQSSTSLTVRVPTGATTGTITVSTSKGTATSATFTVTTSSSPTPYIFSFNPGSGAVGSQVGLAGANFTGVTAVQLNGSSVPFTIDSPNLITATVPAGAATGQWRTIAGTSSATITPSFLVTVPPAVASFAPQSGGAGTAVVISGSKLSPVISVAFGNVTVPFTIDSNSQITAVAPFGLSGPVPITVATQEGVATSAAVFTPVMDQPSILSFTPSVMVSRQRVVISGTNFIGVTGVAFNGSAASSFIVDSPTQITATLPVNATAGYISVATTKGTALSPTAYTLAAPAVPVVSGFSPAEIAGGLPVTITGSGFTNVTAVQFNGLAASTFVVLSPTQILATAPTSLTAGNITVTSSLGTSSTAAYSVTALPIITDFWPTTAPQNRIITVNGANFLGGNVTTITLKVGNVSVSSTSRSANRIYFPAPGGVTSGPITVTTNLGTTVSTTNLVIQGGAAPANDSFDTPLVITGTAGTVYGETTNASKQIGEPNHVGNVGGASVWFSWTAPTSGWYLFDPYDSTLSQYGLLQAIYTGDDVAHLTQVAAGQPTTSSFARYGSAAALNAVQGTTYRIALDGYNGISANYRLRWAPLSVPTVTSFSPSSGEAGQTTTISISGSGFVPGGNVTLGGAPVSASRVTFNSSSSISVTQIPIGAITGPITVTSPVGTGTSVANFVIKPPAPTITSFAPSSGVVGTVVTVNGSAFDGAASVKFAGTEAAAFTVVSATQLTATVPASAATGPISVTTGGGNATSAAVFTVIQPPTIIEQPESQTATTGDTVGITVVAIGNAPVQYEWHKVGIATVVGTSATLSFANVRTADTGSYYCIVRTAAGAVTTNTVTLTVNKAAAAVTVTDVEAVYDGSPKAATVATAPANLAIAITYDGSPLPPIDAGTYTVVATIIDPDYSGSATGKVVIDPAPAKVTLGALSFTYDGAPKPVSATTQPSPLSVLLTYDGSTVAPSNAGNYAVAAKIAERNYIGRADGILRIRQAEVSIRIDDLAQMYSGEPRAVRVTTTPAGIATSISYGGGATLASVLPPTYPGTYPVAVSVTDPNYTGSATAALVISATATIRHGVALNGGVDGSLQVLVPEGSTLNSAAWLASDLLVPGTPNVVMHGNAVLGGTVDATGGVEPSSYDIVLNGTPAVRHIVRRVDASPLAAVNPPPLPTGEKDVVLNTWRDSAGDFATIRDLSVGGNAGPVALPPGTYGRITVAGGASVVLGVSGATEPTTYNLQTLALTGASEVRVVGPVIVTVRSAVVVSGALGDPDHPHWLVLRVAEGGVALNGSGVAAADVVAPAGEVSVGAAKLIGTVVADRLSIGAGGVIQQPSQ